MVRIFLVFISSLAIHVAICVWLFLRLTSGHGWLPNAGAAAFAVAVVGIANGLLVRRSVPWVFGAGATLGAVIFTGMWLWLDWGYRNPVGEPRPFAGHLWRIATHADGVAWLLGPALVSCLASVVGSYIGISLRRKVHEPHEGAER